MRRTMAATWGLVCASLLVGCGEVTAVPCHGEACCPAGRAGPEGTCCAPWEVARGLPGATTCALRPWTIAGEPVRSEVGVLDVAVDGFGRGLVMAAEIHLGRSVPVALEPTLDGWERTLLGHDIPGYTIDPQLAAGPRGEAIAVWQQRDVLEGDVWMAVRAHDGHWAPAAAVEGPLSFSPVGTEPDATFRSDGEALVVWNQTTSTLTKGCALARRPPGAWAFEVPADQDDQLAPVVNFVNRPEVRVNSAGDAVIGWYQSVGAELSTLASERFGGDGTFSRPTNADVLSPPDKSPEGALGYFLDEVTVAIDEDGRAAVAWSAPDDRDGVSVYLATRDGDGHWSAPATLADAFSRRGGLARNPRLATTPSGDLYVAWREQTVDGAAIHLAHRMPNGVWTAQGRVPFALSTPGHIAGQPVLAAGLGGGVVVGWVAWDGLVEQVHVRRSGSDAAGDTEAERWGEAEALSIPADRSTISYLSAAVGGPRDVALLGFRVLGDLYVATVD